MKVAYKSFEDVEEFVYFVTEVTNQNDVHKNLRDHFRVVIVPCPL
jgi:hypothetical protein